MQFNCSDVENKIHLFIFWIPESINKLLESVCFSAKLQSFLAESIFLSGLFPTAVNE